MAEITGQHEWHLKLRSDEMLLILKALGGRLRPDETTAAEQLGDLLTAQKAKHIDVALRENQKLLNNLATKVPAGEASSPS